MEEETVLHQFTPSQVIGFPLYALTLLAFPLLWYAKLHYPQKIPDHAEWVLLLPLFMSLLKYLEISATRFSLTATRLIYERGVLGRQVDEIRLFRVLDLKIKIPGKTRPFGVGDIIIHSFDKSDPTFLIKGIRHPKIIYNQLADLVNTARQNARVTSIEGFSQL